MPRRLVIHTGQEGAAPNQIDMTLDTGYRYGYTLLEKTGGGAVVAADFSYLELILNGKSIWKLTGTQLDEILKSFGYAAFDGVTWEIPHVLLGMKDTDFMTMGELNTGVSGPDGASIYSATLRFVCTVAATTWRASSYVDDPSSEGPGLIRRWHSYQEGGGAAGNEIMSNIKWDYGTDEDQWWCRMYVHPSAGEISQMRIEVGGDRWNGYRLPVRKMLTNTGGRTLGAYYDYVIDFSIDGVGKAPVAVPSTKEVVAGYVPFFDTKPFRTTSRTIGLKVYVTNSVGAATNTYILETLGKAA